MKRTHRHALFFLVAGVMAWTACDASSPARRADEAPEPLAVVLAVDPAGDERIARSQDSIDREGVSAAGLEQLGWAFVERARANGDAGLYVLAEQAALAIEQVEPGSHDAMLLRGHALHSLHRFAQAEQVASELVSERGLPFDHGLLGDVLMEQGKLDAAISHYGAMMEHKPDAHAYSRAAHVRFLTGDLEGAVVALRAALRASSPRNPEAWAWTASRLASLELARGNVEQALEISDAALRVAPESAAAQFQRGRVALVQSDLANAIQHLQLASDTMPLPDVLWALIDALHLARRSDEASSVESRLEHRGRLSDPRGFALYLASKGDPHGEALALATRELAERQDVHTHDVLAWALFASGDVSGARRHMRIALSHDTPEARFFYHAARIAAASGELVEAREFLARAKSLELALLPSERHALEAEIARITVAAR